MWWSNYHKKALLVDAMKVQLKEPVTVGAALEKYKTEAKDTPRLRWVLYQFTNITKAVDAKRPIQSLTIGEFKNADKDCKGAVQRIVRFLATGDINAKATNGNGHVGTGGGVGNKHHGKFSFRPLATADVLKLIPLSEPKGKFGVLKLQIQEFVSSLPKDQSATIDQPKDAHPKTIRIILNEVNEMLEKSRQNWTLHHNPLHEVFILARKSDTKGA
jgi:hypothetical protein